MKRLLSILFAVTLLVSLVTPAAAGGGMVCYKKAVTVVIYRDGKAVRTTQEITRCLRPDRER